MEPWNNAAYVTGHGALSYVELDRITTEYIREGEIKHALVTAQMKAAAKTVNLFLLKMTCRSKLI